MEVASFALVLSLLGQVAADPYSQAPPIPNVAAPLSGPTSGAMPTSSLPPGGAEQPRYGMPPSSGGSAMPTPPSSSGDRYAQPQSSAPPTGPAYSAPQPNYGAPPSYGPISNSTPAYGPQSATPMSAGPISAGPPAAAPAVPSYATPAYAPTGSGAPIGSTVPAAATTPAANDDKSGAGDLVRESLVLPKSLALPGKVTALEELFSTVGDRRRQIDAVRSYWKLTADVADYHFAWQQTQFLKLLGETIDVVEKGPDLQRAKTETASRFAESQARQREAEMKVAATQLELAERAALPPNQQPLPRDLPHVGVYNTSFEKVYAHRTPPARAYLLNRTLPLWRDIISMRAETVWASQDAYDAAFDAYRKGQLEVDDVFLAVEELRERRSEFIAAVRRYNEEIAEYALTSAPDGTSRETLVGMLIKNSHSPKLGRAVVPADAGFVQPVTYVDEFGNLIAAPIDTDEVITEPVIQSSTGAPTLAPPLVTEPRAAVQPAATSPAALPRNEIPAAKVIEQTSATSPITDLPAQSAAEPPSFFNPPAAAMPIPPTDGAVAPSSPFPNAGATVPVRGEPTLAPPEKAADGPLKFKVNYPPPSDVEAANAPGRLPVDIDEDAKPLIAASPYSSGTRPKKKPTMPKLVEPVTATTEEGPRLLVIPEGEAKPIAEAKLDVDTKADVDASTLPPKSTTPAMPSATATTNIHVDAEVEPAGYYTQLGQLPPARRAQELVEQLHGDRGLPTTKDQPLSLDQCMAGSASNDRREIIEAYWRAAEQATRYRVWTQKLERLEVLGQSALQFRGRPDGSIAMLQIRAEKLSVEAARRTTLVELAAAQWMLTNDTRRSLAGPWIVPSTPPHAGGYEAKLAGLQPAAAAIARFSNLVARIPKVHETMVYRAEAVAAADAASDQALQKYAAGQTTIATALHALGREARTTHDLLATVTRYNLDIADYALAAVPGTAPRDALVGALVVDRIRR